MSLAIQTDRIAAVLLADGWHECVIGSFDVDAYEYMWGDELLHGGGNSGVCATGVAFKKVMSAKSYAMVYTPLTAILGVRFQHDDA